MYFYGPFKSYYNAAVDSWLQRNSGKPIDIYHIAEWVNVAFEKSMTPKSIISGFKNTGIYPFDKNIFSDEYIEVSEVTDRHYENIMTPTNNKVFQKEIINIKKPTLSPISHNNTMLQQNERSQDFSTYFSPENIRHYPKAEPRKVNSNNKQNKKLMLY